MNSIVRDSWSNVARDLLRPVRPELGTCLRARDLHLEGRRTSAERRAHALADCVARIEAARTSVFTEGTGVVTRHMTDLEREWRMLARPDVDGSLMDLWSSIAPPSWLDRKRFRDTKAAERLDAAVALASDPAGVEGAERALDMLRQTLAASGTSLPSRVRWVAFERDFEGTESLLENARARAEAALASHESFTVILSRAHALLATVKGAAYERFEARPHLCAAVGHAAFLDFLWRAAALPMDENPAMALRDLWSRGYTVAGIDASSVALELPPL